MLEQWDSGGSFFTIECGGLGPGYEQAIQVAAVEFARANQSEPLVRTGDKKADWKAFDEKCTAVLKKLDEDFGGLSGAQFGAAKWLAWNWCYNGGIKALTDLAKKDGQEDRVIQVSHHWPKAPQGPLDAQEAT